MTSGEDEKRNVSQRERLPDRVQALLIEALSQPLAPGLYLVATPIGHLADISLRALTTLANADYIAAEDTRHSGKLLKHFAIRGELLTYHDHNGDVQGEKILGLISQGKSVALISDAGTPLISDPGYKLVRLMKAKSEDVHVVPGASAVMAALSLSGLPTDSFYFEGFLPAKETARRKRILEIAEIDSSLVLFETAKRLGVVVSDLATIMGPRDCVILRELTKLHEEVIEGTLEEFADELKSRDLKGEIVLVIGAPQKREIDDEAIEAELSTLLGAGKSVRDSVAEVMDVFQLPKRRVYNLALKLKEQLGVPR